MTQRVYVAGPMSGYPEHNFPAFAEAVHELRARGYEVVSPHELSLKRLGASSATMTHDEIVEALGAIPWVVHLKEDLAALLECEMVVLIEGYERSKGAQLELTVARAVDITPFTFQEFIERHDDALAFAILTAQGDG